MPQKITIEIFSFAFNPDTHSLELFIIWHHPYIDAMKKKNSPMENICLNIKEDANISEKVYY